MSSILEQLAKQLPPTLQPLAKAVLPALATLIAIAAQYASTGAFDKAETTTAITGLGAALVAYLTTNPSPYMDEDDELPDDDGLEAFAANLGGPSQPDGSSDFSAPNGHADYVVSDDGGSAEDDELAFANGPRSRS